MNFIDDATFFSDLDELSIIDAVSSEKFRQSECVIIVSIRKYFEAVGECWWFNAFGKINKHATAGRLRPFADGKTGEEVGFAFYASVTPLFTLLNPFLACVLIFLFVFFMNVQNSSTSYASRSRSCTR